MTMTANQTFNQGLDDLSLGHLEQARTEFAAALRKFQSQGISDGATQAARMLALVSERLGDFDTAVREYMFAYEIAKAANDLHGQAAALNGLGSVHLCHDRVRSHAFLTQAAELAVDDVDPRLASAITGNLGQITLLDGHYRRAAELQAHSARLADRAGDAEGRVQALHQLAVCQANLLEFDSARKIAADAVELASKLDISASAAARAQLAKILQMAGADSEAAQQARLAVQDARRAPPLILLGALVISADVHLKTDLTLAHQLAEEARDLAPRIKAPRVGWSASLTSAKALLEQNKTHDALQVLQPAIDDASAAGDSPFLALALVVRSQIEFACNMVDAAKSSLRGAVDRWESSTIDLSPDVAANLGSLERYADGYKRLEQYEVATGDSALALEACDAGRGRLLARQLTTQIEGGCAGPGLSISELLDIPRQLSATIVIYSRVGRGAEERYHAYVIQPDGTLHYTPLPGSDIDIPENFETDAQRFAAAIHSSEDERAQEFAHLMVGTLLPQLYNWFVSPIEGLLPTDGTENVVIVPEGWMFHIPFPALRSQDGAPLVERFAMSIVPSVRVLSLLSLRRRARLTPMAPALVVGSPALLGVNPNAHHMREMREIARIYNVEPLFGDEACVDRVVDSLPSAAVVHIAAHAELGSKYRFGQVAGVIHLASREGHDGRLTAAEIDRVGTGAGVVVLSSCVSGLGQLASEGAVGLTRAFLGTGASSVVASLWQVHTWSAANLMISFHSHLRSGRSPAQAHHAAMLKVREMNPDAIDWAAFSVVGMP